MLWLPRQHQHSSELFLLLPQLLIHTFAVYWYWCTCEELGWNRVGLESSSDAKGRKVWQKEQR